MYIYICHRGEEIKRGREKREGGGEVLLIARGVADR